MTWDVSLFRAVNGLAGQSFILDWLMVELAKPANLLFPILLVSGYWIWRNWRQWLIASIALGCLISITDAVGTQLKELIQRPRPCLRLQGIHELLGCGVAFSFPSNHAVNTAAAAAFFQVLYPKSGWVGWPLTVAIGLSRVYVGVHYVTDVAGGWLLGAMIGGILAWLLRRWSRFQSITQGARNWPRVMRSRLDGRPCVTISNDQDSQ
ncbi:MAG: phosphatase PAP2 family protein [Nitrospiraceae bacterium]